MKSAPLRVRYLFWAHCVIAVPSLAVLLIHASLILPLGVQLPAALAWAADPIYLAVVYGTLSLPIAGLFSLFVGFISAVVICFDREARPSMWTAKYLIAFGASFTPYIALWLAYQNLWLFS